MRVSIVTIGTRGDVQPYLALAVGLKERGHDVNVATLAEFACGITERGLRHSSLRGDYLSAARHHPHDSHGKNSLQGRFSLLRRYVEMARDTLDDEWAATQDAELLIYNPAAFGGFHIAQKLGIPSFAAFYAPLYSPTSDFPSPFFPFRNLGPFNRTSHHIFALLGPILFRRPIAVWRKEVLGLPARYEEGVLNGKRIPILYGFSRHVVPPPPDWDKSVRVTGYWFLQSKSDWTPPPDLVRFLERDPPPIYVGFGSMASYYDQAPLAEIVLDALRKTRQRAIIASPSACETVWPSGSDTVVVHDVPHDWLFPRVGLVIHHGGAGTTAACLRAGKPSVIVPFVGDQKFWGQTVARLGAGPQPVRRRRLNSDRLASAISAALTKPVKEKAQTMAALLAKEDGVNNAIDHITSHVGAS